MKPLLAAGAAVGLIVLAAHAWGAAEPAAEVRSPASAQARLDWNVWKDWTVDPATTAPVPASRSEPEIDVVDARWMALTMWGEARGAGEEAMRAVGHVIDNRRRAGANPRFVTDTVSEAWQFSCWNRGDPNRSAILNIDSLPRESRDYRLWRLARSLAEEILSGRSSDPTGGARFYHTTAVAPRWSAGIEPVQRIGSHLFFQTANGA